MTVLALGAEAQVETGTYLGRRVLRKRRIPKPYRHATLDARLRDERTRDEAGILMRARQAGAPVPVVYDVSRLTGEIVMEHIAGRALRDVLLADPNDRAAARLEHLGRLVALLHEAGLTHGDLTTSNILIPDEEDPTSMVLIDFGLGQISLEAEDRGVDLHLIEEALEATDGRAHELMAACLAGYQAVATGEAALRRLEAIRQRGRYREAT